MSHIFLKIDNMSGESKDSAHIGWCDVKSIKWGASRNKPGVGAVNYKNLLVLTSIDKLTPTVMLYVSNGSKIRKIEISGCKQGGEQIEYYRITLENVIVADVLIVDSSFEPEVYYEFQADKVKIQYWEQTETGIKGAETRSGWDIKNNSSAY